MLEQARVGMIIKKIVRRTGHSRGLIRQILRGQRSDVFRTWESSLEVCLPWLDAQWASGARNATALWRQLKLPGFRGSRRVVGERATRRHTDRLDLERLLRVPSAHALDRLLTTARDGLDPWITKPRTSLVASLANGIGKDHGAVLSAITSPWSSGQVEGQITRLKLVKRQMHGRAKRDLLEARLVRNA